MLTKHHGLGNDFLIAVDTPLPLDEQHAIRWCDRRRGMGADGLIWLTCRNEEPRSWSMVLWNADGSRAELSGNGLRCVGQALALRDGDRGSTTSYRIHTDAGERTVEVHPRPGTDTDHVTVDMGFPEAGPAAWSRWGEVQVAVQAQVGVDMGNPHLVTLVNDPAGVDLAAVGPIVEADYDDGLNVEFISVESRDRIDLRVWERGAGVTEACGSGACAAAWAAHFWGLVDARVEVVMPGGTAVVDVGTERVSLTGPATFIGLVEMEHS